MLPAGELRDAIGVQRPITARQAGGDIIRTWLDVEKLLWSKKEDLSGRELEAAQSLHAEVKTRFTIRYHHEIGPLMRILFAGVAYDIEAVLDKEARRGDLLLLCSTGLTDG